MFFNTFITAGFRPRNQNAKSIQGKFQVTTIGVVSCRTDVMPWYLDKILDSQYQFFLLDTLINHKIDLLTRVRVCSVSFSPVDFELRYEKKGYKTFSEIPLEVAFAGTASTVESTRGQV